MQMGRLTDEEQADSTAATPATAATTGAAATAATTEAAATPATNGAAAVPRDEVDDLITAWRQQRPDLDVAPLQVLSRISRLARHLDIARRGAFAAHDLESWEFDVLSALRRAGPPFQLHPGALLHSSH